MYARLPRLEESPKTYDEVELFLTAIEEEAERAGLPNKRYELAINQMSIARATSYRRLAATKFPGRLPTYERLVEAMVESVAPGEPEGHRLKETETFEAGQMGVWSLREQLDRMYQTYLALCRRTRKVPVIIEQIVGGIYLRYLAEELGAQERASASDADLETLYTAGKFGAAREDRRTTHPLLRDTRGLSLPNGDAAGLLMISGESAKSSDPGLAARETRTAAAPADREVHRHGGGFYGDVTGPPASDSRREGFPDRPARPMMTPCRGPPRPHIPRPRFGIGDVQGRDQGPPMSRNRAAERRYSADPRPARWPQVHVMNVQPSPPERQGRWGRANTLRHRGRTFTSHMQSAPLGGIRALHVVSLATD